MVQLKQRNLPPVSSGGSKAKVQRLAGVVRPAGGEGDLPVLLSCCWPWAGSLAPLGSAPLSLPHVVRGVCLSVSLPRCTQTR